MQVSSTCCHCAFRTMVINQPIYVGIRPNSTCYYANVLAPVSYRHDISSDYDFSLHDDNFSLLYKSN